MLPLHSLTATLNVEQLKKKLIHQLNLKLNQQLIVLLTREWQKFSSILTLYCAKLLFCSA